MIPRIWIDELEFSDSSRFQFNQNDIVVFVGPNNAGKSVSLKEAFQLLKEKLKSKVIQNLKTKKIGTEKDVADFLTSISIIDYSRDSEPYYYGLGFQIRKDHIGVWWHKNEIRVLADLFVNNLTTEGRLSASNPATNIRLGQVPPSHPIHYLQRDDSVEQKFSEYFRQAFGQDLIVHRNAGNEVPLYVGQRPVIDNGEDRLSISYQNKIEKLDLLQSQGDGMRSFVGVLLNTFISHYNIIFIDEPEAFLHPPQARLLGKMLGKDLPTERQLFLATHSSDFLKGLLDSGNSNLKIIRIERDGAINNVRMLNNTESNKIWNDSLLRHSNILDSLFHSRVIICESDSDNRFYSAVLSSLNDSSKSANPDILFIHCGGKHRIPTVIKALKKLNVKMTVVTDFDVLSDSTPFKEIYEELGGNWNEIESKWKIIKKAIDEKKPELESKDLKEQIDNVFSSTSEKVFPADKIISIQKILKKASPWSHAKEVGKAFIPSGDPTKRFEEIQIKLKEKGFYLVEIGELEGFAKSIGNHGPKWVNEVLTRDLKSDVELEAARKFVIEITK